MYAKSICKTLFLLLCCITLLSSCYERPKKPKAGEVTVQVIKITPTTVPVFKDYIGITQSIAQVSMRARVKGFLVKKNFTEGDWVKKGQLLFEIDPRPFKADVDQAKADLQRSEADAAFKQVQAERYKTLVKKAAASQADFDRVNAQYQEAVAQVAVDTAKVEQAEINLSYCYMYAPIDGKIGEKYVDVGNLVGGTNDTLLATIVKLDPIYVQLSPSINDFGEFVAYRKNAPFKVKITIPGYKKLVFDGQIDLVNNEADQTTSTILMRAAVKNPEKLLLPGVYVNVRLILSAKKTVITIPKAAIMETQGQNYVYILDKNNKVTLRTISTEFQYGNLEIVNQGLKPGDIVVVDGLQKIKPGDTVKPRFTQPK